MVFTSRCHEIDKGLGGCKRPIPAKGIVDIRTQNRVGVERSVKVGDTGRELKGGPSAKNFGGVGFPKRHGQVNIVFGGAQRVHLRPLFRWVHRKLAVTIL